jgi:hypothetical protein
MMLLRIIAAYLARRIEQFVDDFHRDLTNGFDALWYG